MTTKESEKKNWQVILPVPFVLDSSVTDEQIITEMASATSEAEATSVLSSALQGPQDVFVLSCTKEELVEALSINKNSNLTIHLQEYEDIYVIVVLDGESAIGRGEIQELGDKISTASLHKKFANSILSFKERFESGQKRMNNLTYKLRSLQNGISTIVSQPHDTGNGTDNNMN